MKCSLRLPFFYVAMIIVALVGLTIISSCRTTRNLEDQSGRAEENKQPVVQQVPNQEETGNKNQETTGQLVDLPMKSCVPFISCEFVLNTQTDILKRVQDLCLSQCYSINTERDKRKLTFAEMLQSQCNDRCEGRGCDDYKGLDCRIQCKVPFSQECQIGSPKQVSGYDPTRRDLKNQDEKGSSSSLASFFTDTPLCEEGLADVPSSMMNRLCLHRSVNLRFSDPEDGDHAVQRLVSSDHKRHYYQISTKLSQNFLEWKIRRRIPIFPGQKIKFYFPLTAEYGSCRHPSQCPGQVVILPAGLKTRNVYPQADVGVRMGIFPSSAGQSGCMYKIQLFHKRFNSTLATASSADALAELVGSCR